MQVGCVHAAEGELAKLTVVEPTSNRHFAMKVLLPEHATNKESRQELFNDAEVGVKMRHENVINILKVNRSASAPSERGP